MLHAVTIGVLVALAQGAAAPATPKTLWLFEPLYPGQEMLATRSEEALRKMMAGAAAVDQLIGAKALAEHLTGRKPDLSCLVGDAACADPIDSFVAGLALDRVVLVKGGQEESSYRFKVTSYRPSTGETAVADGTGPVLDRALLAAMVKVVPLASTLDVATEPPGATVYVDGEKVGVTPYAGQVLPGERVIKLELTSHMVREKKLDVPVRGQLKVSESLEKMPARLVVNALPKGTFIDVDGQRAGSDKVDQAIQPGRHKVALQRDGYLPVEQEIDILPGATATFEKTLEATGWTSVRGAMTRAEDDVYTRRSYFQVNFESARMFGDELYVQEDPTAKFEDTGKFLGRKLISGGMMPGFSVEYGTYGRYFGLLVVGASYYHSSTPWTFTLEKEGGIQEATGVPTAILLRGVQPQLRFVLWRLSLAVQAGLEGRALVLQHRSPDALDKDLWLVDIQATAQASLRIHIWEGIYVEGMFRESWTPISKHAPFRGFHAGVGYAF